MTKEFQGTSEDEKPGPGSGAIMIYDGKTGKTREATQAEYDAEPIGRIFVGIGGFKPPAGKTYKPDPIK
jgi:hypothetical protein